MPHPPDCRKQSRTDAPLTPSLQDGRAADSRRTHAIHFLGVQHRKEAASRMALMRATAQSWS
jgi:hypothetical protein